MLLAERLTTENLALNQLAKRTEADRIRLKNLMRPAEEINPQDFDFLVVMGTVPEINNQPNPAFLARVKKAHQIWQANSEINIVPSGDSDHRLPTKIPQSHSFKQALIELGIPKAKIFPETQAANTPQNIAFSWQLIQEEFEVANPKVVFATSSYHCYRVQKTAEKVLGPQSQIGFAVVPTKRGPQANPEMFWEQWEKETAKLFEYRAKGDL